MFNPVMTNLSPAHLLTLTLHEALSHGVECDWIKARTDLMRHSGLPPYSVGEIDFQLKLLVSRAETEAHHTTLETKMQKALKDLENAEQYVKYTEYCYVKAVKQKDSVYGVDYPPVALVNFKRAVDDATNARTIVNNLEKEIIEQV